MVRPPWSSRASFPKPRFLVFPVGSDQFGFKLAGDERFEVFSCEAFIADDELSRTGQVAAESPEVAG